MSILSIRIFCSTVMSLSKHQISAAPKRKCWDLNEKIAVLDYTNEHPKMDCRKLAEHFLVGKTAISNILKESKNLQRDYEIFKGSDKKRRHGKYHVINKILCQWYGKCTNANVYLDRPFFKKKLWRLQNDWRKKNYLILQFGMDG